jgi:hypothetical protein
VERILDEVESYGKHKSFVRWEGSTAESDTWEPEESLTNAQVKIQGFAESKSDAQANHRRKVGAKRADRLG